MFGDWDGLILRIVVTAIVVLALVALVYWLVRRYAAGGLGSIGRGRVPRLAIVDAMPVDGRRRLVLVRRDNVEHLVLIGGPADVVVEQNIQRPRARQPAKPASPPPAPPPQPFPPPDALFVEPAPAEAEPAPSPPPPSRAHFPVREPETAAMTPPPSPPPAPQPIERPFPPLRRPGTARAEPATTAPSFTAAPPSSPPLEMSEGQNGVNGAGDTDALPEFLRPRVVEEAPSFAVPPATTPAEEAAAKVNDLEREMARLLGEITQKH
ncbi:MAG TPA: flagellar biosynthetic protein FliO [Bauldia sp.]|nr:flagellar biosynthetic protein FliO [Bauldia sp.]